MEAFRRSNSGGRGRGRGGAAARLRAASATALLAGKGRAKRARQSRATSGQNLRSSLGAAAAAALKNSAGAHPAGEVDSAPAATDKLRISLPSTSTSPLPSPSRPSPSRPPSRVSRGRSRPASRGTSRAGSRSTSRAGSRRGSTSREGKGREDSADAPRRTPQPSPARSTASSLASGRWSRAGASDEEDGGGGKKGGAKRRKKKVDKELKGKTEEEREAILAQRAQRKAERLAASRINAMHRAWKGRLRARRLRARRRRAVEEAAALVIQAYARRLIATQRVASRRRMHRQHGWIVVLSGPLDHFGTRLDSITRARADAALAHLSRYPGYKVVVVGPDPDSPLRNYLREQCPKPASNLWRDFVEATDTLDAAVQLAPLLRPGHQHLGLPPVACDVVTSDYHAPRARWIMERVLFPELPRTHCRVMEARTVAGADGRGGRDSRAGNQLVRAAHRERRLMGVYFGRMQSGTFPLLVLPSDPHSKAARRERSGVLAKRRAELRRARLRWEAACTVQRCAVAYIFRKHVRRLRRARDNTAANAERLAAARRAGSMRFLPASERRAAPTSLFDRGD